ncbi:serine carboxypeptidase-like 17 [Rutidosis leptorrhynchoides]|uniref:serine carboxypeptidase-like 17 n=1 Tax=Rutidosis leptorrhynchoides TaxID=125765 RepID=UPI003A98F15A
MKSNFIIFSVIACILCLITITNSKSPVKNLPGFPGDLPFTLETGYVGVGDNDEIQFFYYFVESQRDPLHDPLLLYLSGGPGTPALYAFMYQMGPLTMNLESTSSNNISLLELNDNSWTKVANVIFVDVPAGVGFSYAKTWEASRSGDSILASHTCDFITKWLMNHPSFLHNPLYISGLSYMGILVPFITLKAFIGNERGNQPRLNIKGCFIMSPLTDKFGDFNSRLEYAHQFALIPDDIYYAAKETCHGNYVISDPNNALCSKNLQQAEEGKRDQYVVSWVNNQDVQKALHVREGTKWGQSRDTHYSFMKNDTINYSYDIFSSFAYHKELTKRDCQVLILNGDHDMTFPYVSTLAWITSLNLSIESPWDTWFVGNQIAGYRMTFAKDGYTLNYATVKGAGHSTTTDKPKETLVIVDEWLSSHIHLRHDSFHSIKLLVEVKKMNNAGIV